MGRVEGKVAFVTGAARGQGRSRAAAGRRGEPYVTGMQLRVDAGGYLKWYDHHIWL